MIISRATCYLRNSAELPLVVAAKFRSLMLVGTCSRRRAIFPIMTCFTFRLYQLSSTLDLGVDVSWILKISANCLVRGDLSHGTDLLANRTESHALLK